MTQAQIYTIVKNSQLIITVLGFVSIIIALFFTVYILNKTGELQSETTFLYEEAAQLYEEEARIRNETLDSTKQTIETQKDINQEIVKSKKEELKKNPQTLIEKKSEIKMDRISIIDISGDRACEAIICLSSSFHPEKCNSSLKSFYSISDPDPKKQSIARKEFLNLCPLSKKIGEKDIENLAKITME